MTSFRLAWIAVIAACGGSSSDDWTPPDTDPNETVDKLGAAAYQKLCDEFEQYVYDTYRSQLLIKAACTAHALQTTADATACGEELDRCLSTLPPVVETQLNQILAQASCETAAIDQATCGSKVSMLKACLDALGTLVDQVELSLTCAAFGSPVPEDWWKIGTPAECTALRSGC